MAKGTFGILKEGHPIFREGFVISSGNYSPEYKRSIKNTQGSMAGQSTQTSTEPLLTAELDEEIRQTMLEQSKAHYFGTEDS